MKPTYGLGTCDTIYYLDNLITKNKAFSVQFDKGLWGNGFPILGFMLSIYPWGDHGGVEFSLKLLGFTLIMNWYDRRHWHYEKGRWMTDKEMQDDVPDSGRR